MKAQLHDARQQTSKDNAHGKNHGDTNKQDIRTGTDQVGEPKERGRDEAEEESLIGEEWWFLRDTPVLMYLRPTVLQKDIDLLESYNYTFYKIDMSTFTKKGDGELHAELARQLRFPSYYGKNWDAFNDSLRYIQKISWRSNERVVLPNLWTAISRAFRDVLLYVAFEKRACMVFLGVDHFVKLSSKESMENMLDILALRSRISLINGQKLVILVQVRVVN